MCIYTRFRYLCFHEKIKIAHACNEAVRDPHGVLVCPDDPNPKIDDGVQRTYGSRTYGVGVCSSIHCAWVHSILPLGDFGNDKLFDGSTSFENDASIDDSDQARDDRVDRWYRMLTTDQQLEHLQSKYPNPVHQRSIAGRALLAFPSGAIVAMDTVQWYELNPLYLTPAMLQWCVFSRVLPASLVDNSEISTITPLKPITGPFKADPNHNCPKKHGICRFCGENIGDAALKEATLAHRQKVAMSAMLEEDSRKQDPTGTSLDPSVDLKWDDAKGEYRHVPRDIDMQLFDAPYPATSNPAFVPSLQQPVDTAAVFAGQGAPLTDTGADSMDVDYAFSDWDAFAAAAEETSVDNGGMENNLGELSASILFNLGDAVSMAQEEMDQLLTLNANDNSANAQANIWSPEGLNFPAQPLNTGSTQAGFTDVIDPFLTGPVEESATSYSILTADPTSTVNYDVDVDVDVLQRLADEFIAEQQAAARMTTEIPPETLHLVHLMVYRMAFLREARPSYDPLANELFEQILNHVLAGRV